MISISFRILQINTTYRKIIEIKAKSKKSNIYILKIKEREKEKNYISITLRHGKVYRYIIYLERKKMLNMKT